MRFQVQVPIETKLIALSSFACSFVSVLVLLLLFSEQCDNMVHFVGLCWEVSLYK